MPTTGQQLRWLGHAARSQQAQTAVRRTYKKRRTQLMSGRHIEKNTLPSRVIAQIWQSFYEVAGKSYMVFSRYRANSIPHMAY